MLPGDEIVEKKHKNVKHLMAQAQNTDLSKRPTRKHPGLGANKFKIDFEKQFSAIYGSVDKNDYNSRQSSALGAIDNRPDGQAEEIEPNEINTEVEIQNTLHHKSIIKARNENYVEFRNRFTQSLNLIMTKYDAERKEEIRFCQYWQDNLKEITTKHI